MTQTVTVHRTAKKGYIEILRKDTDTRVARNGAQPDTRGDTNSRAVQEDGMTQFWFDELWSPGASPEVVLTHYKSNYVGMESVDGRTAYVVELSPPTETTASLSLDIDAGNIEYHVPLHEATHQRWLLSQETWWIDTETYYPIKQTVEWTDEDGTVLATATREYKELTVGSAVENTRPVLNTSGEENTASETASAETTNESTRREETARQDRDRADTQLFESAQAAGEAVPFELPIPETPDGYTFDRARVKYQDSSHAVLLLYSDHDSGTQLSVSISPNDSPSFYHNVEIRRESLSGVDGELVVTDTGMEVVRQCNRLTFRVRGPPTAQTLIDVAKSIGC
ncbi:hypothetical protein [Halovenus salina]|uniref:Outer membrane lipoprotein-sorting protein n=2 Tax=Halovenus salina TaxID=1510225 RepID=A0ABD5W1B1_9EURY